MKKSLLFFSAFLIGIGAANAQITITTADVAPAFKVIQQAHDTLPTVTAGSAGASQTWNMAALHTHTIDTLEFLPASYAPAASKFPTANLALNFIGQNQYVYLVNSASSLTIAGQSGVIDFGGGPSNVAIKDMPSEILANFPSTYNTTFTNNFTTDGTFYAGTFGVDSIRQKSVITKTSLVDGWGSLTTPLGTFPSLRFYEIKRQVDTNWFFVSALGGWQTSGTFAPQASKDSSKQYSWWANGVGFPLVTANINNTNFTSGTINSVDWLKATPTTGITEPANVLALNVYPNPAQNQVNFAVDPAKVRSIQISDITGRMIGSYAVSAEVTEINVTDLANGVYSYKLIGKDKVVLNRGKFTVAK